MEFLGAVAAGTSSRTDAVGADHVADCIGNLTCEGEPHPRSENYDGTSAEGRSDSKAFFAIGV
jgi:hypothetical protein